MGQPSPRRSRARGAVTHVSAPVPCTGRERGGQEGLLVSRNLPCSRHGLCCSAGIGKLQTGPSSIPLSWISFILPETSPPLEDPPASSCKQTPAPLHLTGNTKGIKSEAGSLAVGLLFTLTCLFLSAFFLIFFFSLTITGFLELEAHPNNVKKRKDFGYSHLSGTIYLEMSEQLQCQMF